MTLEEAKKQLYHCNNRVLRGCYDDCPLDDCPDLEIAITAVLAELADCESGWISVKDRLPEPMTWVLCHCRANLHDVLRYRPNDGWENTTYDRCYFTTFVTHWMPLPEPPKEGEHETD